MPLRLLATLALILLGGDALAAERPRIVDVELGLGGQYKLGAWAPLRVSVEGGSEPAPVQVVAIAPDADGVGVATTPPAGRPLNTEPGLVTEAVLYTRVGKYDAPIDLRLMVGRRAVDRAVVEAGDPTATDRIEIGPVATATQRTILELGGDAGAEAFLGAMRSATEDTQAVTLFAPGLARVTDRDELPRDAIGYDSFDAVVLASGRSGWLAGLTASDPRVVALERWVRGGGRLVVSCGAGGAELLTGDGPLAPFVPGRFDRLAALPRAASIEAYADADDEEPIALEGGDLQVSRLADTTGVIEAYDGRDPSAMPLVVRAPLGFGEVTFVAFDLDHTAIVGWEGRASLLANLLGPRFRQRTGDEDGFRLGSYSAGTDFVSRFTQRLDAAFTGVGNTPFIAVVGLVVAYLLLIGPGDYFLVKRVIGRMEATWVTFPLIVLVTSAGAYAAARWIKGDDLLVNQIEILDVDTVENRIRGTLVTHLFSPVADRYDLSLEARGLDGEATRPDARSTAWLGKPGYGLGGMETPASTRIGWKPDYAIDPTPLLSPSTEAVGASVFGLPIQVWSTKTLLSVWGADTPPLIDAEIFRNRDGLAEGRLTNTSGAGILDCRLLYGDWALKLGDLADGETADVVSSGSSLVRVSTLLGEAEGRAARRGDRSIEALARLLTMKSSEATDSHRDATDLAHCDLTHHLTAGRALLLARLAGPRSELLRDGDKLVEDDAKRNDWVFVRFILDVDDGTLRAPRTGVRGSPTDGERRESNSP